MNRTIRLAIAAVVAVAGLIGLPTTAKADTATDYYRCVDAGNVWVVVNFKGSYRMGCATSPSTGTDALRQVISVEKAGNGMVSRIGGNPATIDPNPYVYWNYFHRTGGSAWEYSQLGADAYKPKPGSIEGWTYGATGVSVGWSPPARPQPTTAAPGTAQPAQPTQPTQPAQPTKAATTQPGQTRPATTATSKTTTARPTDTSAAPVESSTAPETAPASASASSSVSDASTATPASTPTPETRASVTPTQVNARPEAPVDRGSPVATIATLAVIGTAAAGGGGWWLLRRRHTTP